MNTIIYLLWDGGSDDVEGTADYADYAGFTDNIYEAREHYNLCKDDPYCLGYVDIVTATEHRRFTEDD
jgi:hypothetical protein